MTVLSVLACYCGPHDDTDQGMTGENINQSSSDNKRDRPLWAVMSACLFWTETLDCEDLRIVDF